MDVTINMGEGTAVLSFATDAIGGQNEFTVAGDWSRDRLVMDIQDCGANTAMGYTLDPETASTITLLRTLEFIGFNVDWTEDWLRQAADYDDQQQEAADFGEVN